LSFTRVIPVRLLIYLTEHVLSKRQFGSLGTRILSGEGGWEIPLTVAAVTYTANIISFSSSIPRKISTDLTGWCFGEENG
jgi:hypothetical protein